LQENERRFGAIVQHSSDVTVLLNANGTIRYVSPAIEWTLGYTPNTFVGKDPFTYIHPDDLPRVRAKFNKVMQQPGQPTCVDFRLKHTDGVWISFEAVTNNLLDTPEVEAIIVNARDITERKRAEVAILQASRLEIATTLAGGVAHRVNNLMTAAIGFAELLKHELQHDSEALLMLETILDTTQQTSDLAQQMVAFAEGGKYRPRILDLNHITKEVLEWKYINLPNKIHLEYNLEPNLWKIEADPLQMNQVLLHLLTNALEAVDGTGTIIVTTENILLEKTAKPHTAVLSPGKYICLSVVDTGRGMTSKTLARIFEPFFTTKFQGRGMGLSAVYGIVNNHGGYVFITSQPEQGTTCQVYLPAVLNKLSPLTHRGE
jgi:PAS domain S-box-containing protein